MSRYVHVELSLAVGAGDLEALLTTLGLQVQRGPVCLPGSLECHGEPVDLRVSAGPHGTIEDFGFVLAPKLRLICGELDRRRLEAELLPVLLRTHAQHRVLQAAAKAGLRVEAQHDLGQGRRRIILRRDS